MSIFGPVVRVGGSVLPLATGTGPIVDGTRYMHLWVDADGAVISVIDGIIHHYGAGLPFDVNGRLVVSSDAVAYVDQATPHAASGAVAMIDDATTYVDQGVPFNDAGAMVADGLIVTEFYEEYDVPPGDFLTAIGDFGLSPQATCISLQIVITLKVDYAAIPGFIKFFEYRNYSTGTERFSVLTNDGNGGFDGLIEQAGTANPNRINYQTKPLAGATIDLRCTLKPVGSPTGEGYRGWLGKTLQNTHVTPTEFPEALTHVVWDATYFDLRALRINHDCRTTDEEIMAWPMVTIEAAIYGDSFANGPFDLAAMTESDPGLPYYVRREAVGGNKLATIYATSFLGAPPIASDTWAILEGGINDVVVGGAVLADMQTPMQAMVDYCISVGIHYTVVGITPWKTATAVTWTQAKQDITDDYNAWAAATFQDNFVSMYALMESPAGSDALNPALAEVDLLHPSATGFRTMDTELVKYVP